MRHLLGALLLKAYICAGSGKTLAYLLPLVQRMREEEQSASDSLTLRNSPRVLVLVPTAELCTQVDCPFIAAAMPVIRAHETRDLAGLHANIHLHRQAQLQKVMRRV